MRTRDTNNGYWIDLPQPKTFDFHGFDLEVSKINFETADDRSCWVGFSGSLKLSTGLPVSITVEGLQIHWKGSDASIEFTGAKISLEIPDFISFSGHVKFVGAPKELTDSSTSAQRPRFEGSGKLKILPSGLETNAELVISKNEKDPAYSILYFFSELQLPPPGVPLSPTGISIQGIAGLFEYNMEPGKKPELVQYDGWYKDPVGISTPEKWQDKRGTLLVLVLPSARA